VLVLRACAFFVVGALVRVLCVACALSVYALCVLCVYFVCTLCVISLCSVCAFSVPYLYVMFAFVCFVCVSVYVSESVYVHVCVTTAFTEKHLC
jgi:hypothetical protein